MKEAVKGNIFKVQEKAKSKRWTSSEDVARQGAGVFLGGKTKDFEANNPFKSEKQRRYLWAKHPKIAKKWAHEK